MIAVAFLAFQALNAAGAQPPVPTAVLVISTVFSGVGLVITAAGAIWIQRGQKAARTGANAAEDTAVRIGEPNGQHDLVTMISNLQKLIATLHASLERHEAKVDERFDGLHLALRAERRRIDAIEDRK